MSTFRLSISHPAASDTPYSWLEILELPLLGGAIQKFISTAQRAEDGVGSGR